MTFRQSLNGFADRVLNTTLGTVEAGACVPENGSLCGCLYSPNNHFCWQYQAYTRIQYSCYGHCTHVNYNACCA